MNYFEAFYDHLTEDEYQARKRLILDIKSTGLPLIADDIRYIEKHIAKLDENYRVKLLEYFKYIWITEQVNCDLKAHQQENAGRRAASEWLRKFLDSS